MAGRCRCKYSIFFKWEFKCILIKKYITSFRHNGNIIISSVLNIKLDEPFLPGRASFCSVRVILTDENDNVPRFRAVEYRMSIKANVAKGSLVTQIQASDPDAGSNGRITYSLYSEARLSLVDVLEVSRFCLSSPSFRIFFQPTCTFSPECHLLGVYF